MRTPEIIHYDSVADRKTTLGDIVVKVPWWPLAAMDYTIYMHYQCCEISLVSCITPLESKPLPIKDDTQCARKKNKTTAAYMCTGIFIILGV